jgi:hypothetical protein
MVYFLTRLVETRSVNVGILTQSEQDKCCNNRVNHLQRKALQIKGFEINKTEIHTRIWMRLASGIPPRNCSKIVEKEPKYKQPR